jgi:hypothetical protein
MKKTIPPYNSLFFDGISTLIHQFRLNTIRLINYQLINLFWEIGREINNRTAESLKNTAINVAISQRIGPKYGYYFTESNISSMRRFAVAIPELSELRSLPEISWSHICVLIELENISEILFYANLAFEKDLNVLELRESISKNMFKKSKNTFREKPRFKPEIKRVVDTLFENQLPFVQEIMNSTNQKKNISIRRYGEISFALTIQIEDFKDSLNRRLNTELNKLFWSIGTRINEVAKKEKIGNKDLLIAQLADMGKKKGILLTKVQLKEMSTYADQVRDMLLALRLNKLLSWKYISALLPLLEIEEKYFYARLAASNGLSVPALNIEIENGRFNKTKKAMKLEQTTIATIQNPVNIVRREESKNAVFIGTEYSVNFGEDVKTSKAIIHFFKSPFLKFITAR